jgi:hypothetical protein
MSVLPRNESEALLGNSSDLIAGTAVTTRATQMLPVMIDRIGVNFSKASRQRAVVLKLF